MQFKRLTFTMFFLIFTLLLASMVSAQAGTVPDDDGDGVPNPTDLCPDVPGPATNNGCPLDPDSDGDGLVDSADTCPSEAGPRENGGCPLVVATQPPSDPGVPTAPSDRDGDGISDDVDRCPDEAGTDAAGCPVVEEPIVTLVPLPTDGECVASPNGNFSVKVREYPTIFSDQVETLTVNQIAPVLDVANLFFYAEPERVELEDFSLWYQIDHKGVNGWVAADVVRLGGDCSDFMLPFPFGQDDLLAPDSGPLEAGYIRIDGVDGESSELKIKLTDILVSSYQAYGQEVPEMPLLFDLITLTGFTGGVNVATGDVNGDGSTEAHSETLSLNYEEIKIEIGGETGIMDIIVGSGGGSQPAPATQTPLDLAICLDVADPEAPLTEDCVIISSSTLIDLELDLLAPTVVCVTTPTGLDCEFWETTSAEDCVPVAGFTACANDYLPEDMCVTDPDDGHLICTFFEGATIYSLNPDIPLPTLNIFAPKEGAVGVGLLLPAVQKVREAARR